MTEYVHGFDPTEQRRLVEQAGILAPKVYQSVDFGGCKKLLEVGSGVGAQTQILLERFPDLEVTCVDRSSVQLAQARINLASFGNRVRFEQQDGCQLHLDERFDSAFVCWTLEHVASPVQLLAKVREHLLVGSRVYVTEVFNSSFFTSPGFPHLRSYMEALNAYQRKIGGHPDVGIDLGKLLTDVGFSAVSTRFDGFYLDKRSKENKKIGISYWKELLKSTSPALVESGDCSLLDVENMLADLDKLGENENSIFFYQFVQAKATL